MNGMFSTSQANNANALTQQMASRANSIALGSQGRQMVYNSSPVQVQLAKSAGLNPGTVQANSTTGTVGASSGAGQMAQTPDFSKVADAFTNQFSADSQNQVNQANIGKIIQETTGVSLNNDTLKYFRDYMQPAEYSNLTQQGQKLLAETLKTSEEITLTQENRKLANETLTQLINNRELNKALPEAELKKIYQDIFNSVRDLDLKEAQQAIDKYLGELAARTNIKIASMNNQTSRLNNMENNTTNLRMKAADINLGRWGKKLDLYHGILKQNKYNRFSSYYNDDISSFINSKF